MREEDIMVEVRNVSKRYKEAEINAISNVSLTIKKGEIVLIIGKNGAGKTTLIKMLSGLVYPTHGKVKVFNESVEHTKNRISVLFEDNYLYPSLSGFDNLILLSNKIRISRDNLFNLLNKFGLSNRLLSKKAKGFSHGQGRRLLLTAAISRNPDLFLLDEPFNGLDSQGVKALLETMIIEKNKGKTFIVTGQNLFYLTEIIDRVIWIDDGKIAYDGDASGVRPLALGYAVIETNNASQFASFLLSKNIKFLSANGKFFVETTLEKAREIKKEVTKAGIVLTKFNFTSIEDGGQSNEDFNKEWNSQNE